MTEGTAEGQPFNLLPWYGFYPASLFGWYREGGLCRFRMAWAETGKGQAKSPLMAGIGLYMMGFAGKEHSEVYAIAGDKDQANVLFKDGVAMCRATIPDCDEGDSLEARGTVVIRGTGDNALEDRAPGVRGRHAAGQPVLKVPVPVAKPVPIVPPSLEKPWWQTKEVVAPVIAGGGLTSAASFVQSFGGIPWQSLIIIVIAVFGGLIAYQLWSRHSDKKAAKAKAAEVEAAP